MSRTDWTIADYIEELICLWEVDHVPEVMRKIIVIKTELVNKFSLDELKENGITVA
jgi:hypothetical protein